MTDYILITSVTAEKLFGIFEESVRETCAKDYSAVQLDAWIARATPARWQQLLSGDLHFIAAVNQTSGELAGFASIILTDICIVCLCAPDIRRKALLPSCFMPWRIG